MYSSNKFSIFVWNTELLKNALEEKIIVEIEYILTITYNVSIRFYDRIQCEGHAIDRYPIEFSPVCVNL